MIVSGTEHDAPPVDVASTAGHSAGMPRRKRIAIPERRTGRAWVACVDALIEAGEDARLVEIAAEEAGTQEQLSALSGLTEESISRGHTGATTFSSATRAWLRAYLLNPAHPPPPMPRGRGPKAKAGAVAPQVRVNDVTHAAFAALAVRPRSRSAVMEWCIRNYVMRHAKGKLAVPPSSPRGAHVLRERVDPVLLARFDARVGGPHHRVAHLLRAIEEGLPLLVAEMAAGQRVDQGTDTASIP